MNIQKRTEIAILEAVKRGMEKMGQIDMEGFSSNGDTYLNSLKEKSIGRISDPNDELEQIDRGEYSNPGRNWLNSLKEKSIGRISDPNDEFEQIDRNNPYNLDDLEARMEQFGMLKKNKNRIKFLEDNSEKINDAINGLTGRYSSQRDVERTKAVQDYFKKNYAILNKKKYGATSAQGIAQRPPGGATNTTLAQGTIRTPNVQKMVVNGLSSAVAKRNTVPFKVPQYPRHVDYSKLPSNQKKNIAMNSRAKGG